MSYTNPELEKKIHELFDFKNDGYFVDIGAHNGISLSNTKFLEELGWTGICIEPHPNVFKQLVENRKCEKINCALWENDTKVNFLSLSGYTEMLSGIYESYDSRHYNRILNELKIYGGNSEMIEIDAKKFESVVTRKKIDFLSIDTEGSELQILGMINFDEYDIKVICVENNFFEEKFNTFFEQRGYKLYTNVFIDYLYVKNN
jgi:FkbM family methyltransferase